MTEPSTPTRAVTDPLRLPPLPSLVVGEVRHARRHPIEHDVRMRTHLWLVDLDDLPRSRPSARFDVRDHFDGVGPTIKHGVARFVEAQGERIEPGDRVVMLAAPRTLGHVFNPLSVHWCLTTDGRARFVVLEVHNTYGQRHAYLLHPDVHGVDAVDKEFYVSPFFAVRGRYRVRLTLQPDRVAVRIVLDDDGPVFAASFAGRPDAATRTRRVRAALRTPLAPQQTSGRIRWHGIRLWRRLPVVPRPPHTPPPGLSPREEP